MSITITITINAANIKSPSFDRMIYYYYCPYNLPVACWNLCCSALIESPRTKLVLGVDCGDSSGFSYPFVSLDERLDEPSRSKLSWLNLFWILSNLSLVRVLFTVFLPSIRSGPLDSSAISAISRTTVPSLPISAVTVMTFATPFLPSESSGLWYV